MGYRSIISLMPKSSVDADAQAFLTAAAITDPTISGAINTLVVQMKADNIWSKMRAVYPMVGGTANSHKFNLKDPRDLDAAFRLSFSGGWTHSANGATSNGTNAFANTFFNTFSQLGTTAAHQAFYNRMDITNSLVIHGCNTISTDNRFDFGFDAGRIPFHAIGNTASSVGTSIASTSGFIFSTRTGASSGFMRRNTTNIVSALPAFTSYASQNYFISARNTNGSASLFGLSQIAYFSLGDSLTDTEAANLYTAVQTFQTTLGRSVGTQTVSDSDAQAFVTNAAIVDQVEATAVNNLVVGMKADGIWSKMKAIYPFVGGSASAHKFNLKDPRDLDAAFRIVFNGGWTHSNNGATPNGTNGFADTKLLGRTDLTTNNSGIGIYSGTESLNTGGFGTGVIFHIYPRFTDSNTYYRIMNSSGASTNNGTSLGFFHGYSDGSNGFGFYNGIKKVTMPRIDPMDIANLYFGGQRPNVSNYDSRQLRFAFASVYLTDTEAANLYTRVQAFQTALSRQV